MNIIWGLIIAAVGTLFITLRRSSSPSTTSVWGPTRRTLNPNGAPCRCNA